MTEGYLTCVIASHQLHQQSGVRTLAGLIFISSHPTLLWSVIEITFSNADMCIYPSGTGKGRCLSPLKKQKGLSSSPITVYSSVSLLPSENNSAWQLFTVAAGIPVLLRNVAGFSRNVVW